MRANFRTLGGGLSEHGKDLNKLFAEARPLAVDSHAALDVLDKQRLAVARLVDSTGTVLQAIGERKEDLRTLATSARASAIAADTRDKALASVLRNLPSTLTQARKSTANLGSFSTNATPTLTKLRSAARNLGPVIRDLEPTAAAGRELFDELPGVIRVANPLLTKLATFARATSPTINKLGTLLDQANPALAFLEPYSGEFGAFFANVGSAVDSNDAVGKIGRVYGVLSENTIGALTVNEQKAINALIKAGGLEKIHYVDSNGYPKPGTIGKPMEAGDGKYTPVPAVKRAGR